ncbi:hypothetical protein IWQ60_009564 [Tieghemiomyces parasiticus]|uniref:PPM-type phosphatase domain-containing protein n=1 Tax=Tieghemiomyces parasiticus TaxID=78921 RepID=A0A9W8DKY0_9FUNG|nr:hypothetical protein IWQ60_009564 [Tieghemiomyces parasiticus]
MKVRYGTSTARGRRPTQQDEALVVSHVADHADWYLFVVLDGHGQYGHKVSQFAKSRLPKIIHQFAPRIETDTAAVLTAAFAELNEEITENVDCFDPYLSGTTVTAALFLGDVIHIANVGDSRIIHGQGPPPTSTTDNPDTMPPAAGWQIKQLTRDHTCSDPEEQERVVSKGARVERMREGDHYEGPLRIFKGTLPYPGLVVTRALGDTSARKLGVIGVPELTTLHPKPGQHCLVLATDGVWDGLTNEDVVGLVTPHFSVDSNEAATTASHDLTDASLKALDRIRVDDNTTNVCVFFTCP